MRLKSFLFMILVQLFPWCAAMGAQTAPAAADTGAFLDVEGVKIWYEECGAQTAAPGVNVVLLHDGLVHSITWDGVWAPLCAKYHVVRYDRRGYGRSEAAKATFRPEEDLYRVMRQVRMERAIVVGNSSGGALALDFALAHPEMVDGLFLIGPVVHGMASSDYFNERGAKNSAPLEKGDVKRAAENWSRDRFIIGGEDARARKILYEALMGSPQNLSVGGELEIRPSPPAVMRLRQIRAPVLILVGEADIADVFAHSGAIEAGVRIGELEVWKDVGHLIQIQRPGELVTRFNSFVALAERKDVPLSEGQLAVLAGHYNLGKITANVFIQENRLTMEFPGSPYYQLFATSETRFFLRNDDAEIEFTKDAGGKVLELVIHNSDGSTIRCPRADQTSAR